MDALANAIRAFAANPSEEEYLAMERQLQTYQYEVRRLALREARNGRPAGGNEEGRA